MDKSDLTVLFLNLYISNISDSQGRHFIIFAIRAIKIIITRAIIFISLMYKL